MIFSSQLQLLRAVSAITKKKQARSLSHYLRRNLLFYLLLYVYLVEKYEFVSWDDYSQLNGQEKIMFQTTNQVYICSFTL